MSNNTQAKTHQASGGPKLYMLKIANTLVDNRELILALAWKNIVVRCKQAYLGLAWAALRPSYLW